MSDCCDKFGRILLVSGDTLPAIKVVVKDKSTCEPMSLVGATARLLFRPVGSTTLQATLVGTLLTGLEDDDGTIDVTAPYDVAGAGGRVSFAWAPGDLDCDPGEYEGEVKVAFSGGSMQSSYGTLKFRVRERFGA